MEYPKHPSTSQMLKCEKQCHLAHTCTTPKEPYHFLINISMGDNSIVSDIVIQVQLFT